MADQALDRDGWVRVETSTNKMEAYLIIEPPTGNGNWPTLEQALGTLRGEKIVFGLNQTIVAEVIASHQTGVTTVAVGQVPAPGEDAKFTFLFEKKENSLTEDEFGRVDYREQQTVQNIVTGQVLMVKTPATLGEPGFNVLGQKLDPKPGKDKHIKVGKNVIWANDGLRLVSTINGEPSYINGKISVFPLHQVDGDVNFKTGNISFLGSVVIRGNVDAGFKVEAEGDVVIHGMVEAADLKVGGNLTICGGVSGMDKTTITCGGDFNAKFIEHAILNCDGNVLIKEAIMYCQVNADQNITVDMGKGLIVGGLLRTGEEISAKIIGSKFGTMTELELGVKPGIKIEYQQLEEKIKDNKIGLDKAEKAVAMLEKIPNLPPDRQEMYQNLLKTTYVLKGQISQAEARRKEILEEMLVLSKEKARVKVKDTLFPGVRVSIGKATTVIRDEIKYTFLAYVEGEIQFQSYR